LTAGTSQKKVWTILEMLQWGTTYLTEKGFDESRLTVELLLSHVLSLQRIQLYMSFDRPLSEREISLFKEMFQRRLRHEPLQYITGSLEFMGLEFLVDRRVLIPRPETEVLVEHAIKLAADRFAGSPARILDIGTGSGCIAIALAKMIEGSAVTAIDVSEGAIALAKINGEKNGVVERVDFLAKDIFKMESNAFPHPFHLVVSNPPYISTSEFAGLAPEIAEYEPNLATTDGSDGLTFYRHIAKVGKSMLLQDGVVIVECAYNQSIEVQKIFRDAGWSDPEIFKDYSGNPRGLIAHKVASSQ